jgi:hypothetical protein
MVDKITTVPKTKVGSRVGRLDDEISCDSIRLHSFCWPLGVAENQAGGMSDNSGRQRGIIRSPRNRSTELDAIGRFEAAGPAPEGDAEQSGSTRPMTLEPSLRV